MSLPSKIVDLVDRFRTHEASYLASDYGETSLRDDFLDPMFAELGWDLNNVAGYAQAYRDVIKEESFRTTEGVKSPDFTFRIGGTRKFFVEAKRPSISIATAAAPAYQLRRYAWNAKLPLSILTNFREFAVYDTREKPEKSDGAAKNRVFYCKYDELHLHWPWLSSIFARDAILKGSFDKYVDDNKAKRGTAEVDDAFLQSIEGWRRELAVNIALRNSTINENELNYSVQTLLDRIIFLRICEDRGIEPYGRLLTTTKANDVYEALSTLFLAADAKYNSGLFHFKKEKGRRESHDSLSLGLNVDDKVLRRILGNLYYPASDYEFSVIPSDILGQIYEQFLGHIIRLGPRRKAVLELKPSVRKAGGVYYTPSYIVEYMIERTLSPLLKDKTPNQISRFRIIDPACGSGSFLISAYQHMLDWHLAYYASDPNKWRKGAQARIFEDQSGMRLTIGERRRILTAHIFGVDIDSQAVEVTKLSLLLKVLEGETNQTVQPKLSVLQDRVLPDLGNNIKCGNSLIGEDVYDSESGSEVDGLNAFQWNGQEGFAEAMTDGGFNVVIGNPPYIFARDLLSAVETAYFSSKYKFSWDKHNTYLLFMELLLRLLSKKGTGAFIVPNSWMTIESGKLLRQQYIDLLIEIADLNYAVFNKVGMEPCIFFLGGSKEKGAVNVLRANSRAGFAARPFTSVDRTRWRNNSDRITLSQSKETNAILERIVRTSSTVADTFDVRTGLQAYERGKGTPPQTAADVKNHVFDEDRKVDNSTYRYLQGRDVGRDIIDWSGDWMRYGPWLSQPRELAIFTRPRVLLREVTGSSPYALFSSFTDEQYLSNKSVITVLHDADDISMLKCLSAILNSKLITAYYRGFGVKGERRLFPKVVIKNLREFPFPKDLSPVALKAIVSRVDALIASRTKAIVARSPREREAEERKISTHQAALDDAVFKLFGVTTEEKVIIEMSLA